ncbi:DUF4153 domain-containing protein [Inquilinus sp. OTU3971]|uniref:DUF4153 domain-containing protein n=1 Tax=Inquilinus sp. OTU3971 TaxID=3043855 RepID=UPI00313E6745
MNDSRPDAPEDMRSIGAARLLIGLLQGVVLYLLWRVAEDRVWATLIRPQFAAAALATAYVPLIALVGLGSVRLRTLLIWAAAAALVLAGLGVHDATRAIEARGGPWPSFGLWVFAAAILFIAHHLIAAADAERRIVASYPRYFEIAWKNGVQLALSCAFIGVFWLVLHLGAALFDAIGIGQMRDVIRERWFAFPATSVMAAAAIHLTDVRSGLIRGIRTVALTLLAWLLPLLTVLAAAFLLALPFTGLEPLWRTRSAAALLLGAAATLIILINAAYQDGQPDQPTPAPLRWGGRLAAILLIPLIGLAAYAIWLRVDQHGLTPERVIGVACVLVGACYALGYAAAALRAVPWLKGLEATNIAAGVVVVVVVLALLTPPADPARLSVADQLGRLENGTVSASEFDYDFLRFDGGRYGRAALERMVAQGGAAGEQAAEAQRRDNRWRRAEIVITPEIRLANIKVWPDGRTLPDGFLRQEWSNAWALPACLKAKAPCEAFFGDLTGDSITEILLSASDTITAYQEQGGRWELIGRLQPNCPGLAEAIRKGNFAPAPSRFADLDVAGRRLRLETSGAPLARAECGGP